MMSEKTTELVARAKQGDSAAFEALYIEYKDRLTKFVMKKGLPEQDAEDIVSDTFVEVMKHIQDLDNNEFFGTWIHRIALNKANLFHNRQNRMQRASFDTQDSLDSDLDKIDGEAAAIEQAYESEYGDTVMLPSDYAENEDTKRIIAEQINSLSGEHKEALVLFYYDNRSINEIAEMTGTNPNNVKARLFRARQGLKKKLEVLQKKGVKFHLILAGQGPDMKEIETKISDLGLRSRTHLAGHITDSRLLDGLYSRAALFAFPSLYEGMPLQVSFLQ